MLASWLLALLAVVPLGLLQGACRWLPRSGPCSLSLTSLCLFHHYHYWLAPNFSFSITLWTNFSMLLHLWCWLLILLWQLCWIVPDILVEKWGSPCRASGSTFREWEIDIKAVYFRVPFPVRARKYLQFMGLPIPCYEGVFSVREPSV